MAKIRVYELARDLGVESKDLLAKLKALKIDVGSHQSTLSPTQIDKVRGALAAAKPKIVVRRRKKVSEEETAEEISQETEEAAETAESEIATEIPPTLQEEEEVEAGDAVEIASAPAEVAPSEEAKSAEKAHEAKAEEKGDDILAAKRKSFVGATIIRRATPEEEAALQKKKEERKLRTKQREQGPAQARTPELVDSDSLEARGEGVREKKKETRARTEEDEEGKRIKHAVPKRRSVSTRDLLAQVSDEDVEEVVTPAARRRTVYTPTLSQKKRDIKRRKDLRSTQITTPRASYRVVKMNAPTIQVAELAKQLHVKVGEIIKKLMDQGVMVTANQNVDFDTASLIATEYHYECKQTIKTLDDVLNLEEAEKFEQITRPPIVTVMGHVDHGKTTILDAIRKSDVANGEVGGITQHIGAYTVDHNGFKIAFLDTPGHEAFSAMRARGARLTDIVILVVAADDGVMPQTREAIQHARDAGVPIIVAINKIDKPNPNFDRIFTELSEQGVQTEGWGGDIQCVKVSAKQRIGIDELLEAIQIQSEMLELTARTEGRASGIVLEAHLDKGLGAVATIMVTQGTLSIGQFIVAGKVFGRVRGMRDHNGKAVKEASASIPVEITGLTDIPMAGDSINVAKDEKSAREAVAFREARELEGKQLGKSAATLDELLSVAQANEIPELSLVLKADTQGSAEAIAQAIENIHSAKVRTKVLTQGVGDLTDSDLSLAETSKSAILTFNVKISRALSIQAGERGVVIKPFSIIYDVIEAVRSLMVSKLPPVKNEVVQGHAEVRNTISVPRVGVVAGSSVTDGKITRNAFLRVIRNAEVIYIGKIASLRRFKDDVKEVPLGYECGISIDGFNEVKIGDVLEAYQIEESPPVLDV
ncbi:MAG: translation initiation factor IF-2 [Deltaproteobacteria bacterium]|nr:translation initiation factor IF-2 [Deltaproteobacteria bacterium]